MPILLVKELAQALRRTPPRWSTSVTWDVN